MPVARGLMQIGRFNIYKTTTTITSFTPASPANCGDLVTFNITVSNNTGGGPTPTGTVALYDKLTDTLIASGTLSGGTVSIASVINLDLSNIEARYLGVLNSFSTSTSTPAITYVVNLIPTTVSFDTPNLTYVCITDSLTINANVIQNSGPDIPTGNVRFELWTNDVTHVTLSTQAVDGSGNASYTISAGAYTGTYYLRLVYLGDACFAQDSTASGTSGIEVSFISSDTSNTNCSISGSSTFCAVNSATFNATIYSDHFGVPNAGTVNFYASNGGGYSSIGSGSVSSGYASLTVGGGTFTGTISWNIYCTFSGDGGCIGGSTSNVIGINSITSDTSSTTCAISGSSTFCRLDSTTFTATVNTTNFGLANSGTVTWYATGAASITLGSASVSSGVATLNVSGGTFTSVGSYSVYAVYSGNSCIGGSTSSTISVTATTYTSSISMSGPTLFCYTSAQTFSATVSSGSSGTIVGTAYLYDSGSGLLDSQAVNGSSSGVTVNFSAQSLAPGDSFVFAEFVPSGSSCYSSSTSSNYTYSAKSSSTQFPSSTTLSISPGSGAVGGASPTNFTFTVTVNKGSGDGDISGTAGIFWVTPGGEILIGSATVTDAGSFSSGTFSVAFGGYSGGAAAGPNAFYAYWGGNSCFGSAFDATSIGLAAVTLLDPN